MSGNGKLKPFPEFKTDEEAEIFVATADLTEYDFSEFKPANFEFRSKSANISMRVPQQLLDAIKLEAKREGMPYQRFIRQVIEVALAQAELRRT